MNWKRISFATLLFLVALTSVAVSQGIVSLCYFVSANNCQKIDTTTPLPVTGTTTSTPTALTSTEVAVAPTATVFSSLLAASSTRKGCLIQNTGTTLGYVYFGATGSATTSNTFQVTAGNAISCATQTGGVVTENVAGTCASSTCAFVVGSQ